MFISDVFHYILKILWKKRKSCKLQSCLLKKVLEHDEISEDNWEEKENERFPYLKNDKLSTAFSYARYSKGMKNQHNLGWKIVWLYHL